jgi:hypothetical protein
MRRYLTILAIGALVVAGLATAASARSDSRPFKGSVDGVVFFVPDTECPNDFSLRTDSEATGTVSHLGRTTMTSQHCTPDGTDIAGGTMTLVGANGDAVFIEYAGTAPPPDPDTGIITVDLVYVIVGGDGRYEDAHGGGDMVASVVFEGFDDMEWPGSWSWTGRIGY